MDRVRYFRRAMLRWARLHPRSFPWRDSKDPYAVLVGEVLLQRTRGEHVGETYLEFIRRWPTPHELSTAQTRSIASVIRPLGLKKRAKQLRRLGQALEKVGAVPTDPIELELLPGVGPYAAHAVPIFAKGLDLPLMDWVIARVVRRFFGLSVEKRPNADSELWELGEHLVVNGRARDLWLGTLDFAAAVCRPLPLCEGCPLSEGCAYLNEGSRVSVTGRRITHV